MALSTAVAVAIVAVFTGSLVQGVTGFGMGLVAVPLLAFVMPEHLPQVLIVLMIPATLWHLVRERASLRIRSVAWIAGGRVLGTVPGVLLVQGLSETSLQVAFAIITIIAVATMAMSELRVPINASTQVTTGVVSGVMATSASIGGPPLVLLYAHRSGPELRAVIAGVVFLGNFVSLAGLAIVGRVDRLDLLLALGLLVPMYAGLYASRRLAHRVDEGPFRAVVLAVVLATSVALLAKSLF